MAVANVVWGRLGRSLFFAFFGDTALYDKVQGKMPVTAGFR